MGDPIREDEVESRWEAAPAIALVIVLQVAMAMLSARNGWTLPGFPWWTWLVPVVPEAVLLAPLALSRHRQLEQLGSRRTVALTLMVVVGLANAIALGALIASLTTGHETNGAELLLKGLVIWTTNVIAFGLVFWEFDRGGPLRRRLPDAPWPDFQFPQMENPQLAPHDWHPRFVDYLYVSFTNSIAFSPTDSMPLTHRAKLLMLAQAGASGITLLLVAARAVNILT